MTTPRTTAADLTAIHERLAADYTKLVEHWERNAHTTHVTRFVGIDTERNRTREAHERAMVLAYTHARDVHQKLAEDYRGEANPHGD